MEKLRSIIHICCVIADIAIPVMLALSLALAGQNKRLQAKDPSRKASKLPFFLATGSIFAAVALNVLYFSVAVQTYSEREKSMEDLPAFSVYSEDLHDGKWDAAIGKNAENKSPQLSWDTVSGASAYGIVMVDPDARNWMHWKDASVKTAGIPSGYAAADTYVGPYPPAGETHTYTVYIAALKQPKDGMTGMLDAPNDIADHDLKRSLNSLDITEDGKTGNVIAIGTLSGTYTSEKT